MPYFWKGWKGEEDWRVCHVRIRRVIDTIKYVLQVDNRISDIAGQNKQRRSKKSKVLR